MTTPYVPRWLAGAEALDHLARAGHDGRTGFVLLLSAIRDGQVTARTRGRERERQVWKNWGLSPDRDFVEKVDGPWRNKFIYADPATVDIDAFSAQSEVLRSDLVRCFPLEVKASKPQAASSRAGRKKGDGTVDDTQSLEKMRSLLAENKAKSINEAATMVVTSHGSEIPGNGPDAKTERLRKKFAAMFGPASSRGLVSNQNKLDSKPIKPN